MGGMHGACSPWFVVSCVRVRGCQWATEKEPMVFQPKTAYGVWSRRWMNLPALGQGRRVSGATRRGAVWVGRAQAVGRLRDTNRHYTYIYIYVYMLARCPSYVMCVYVCRMYVHWVPLQVHVGCMARIMAWRSVSCSV